MTPIAHAIQDLLKQHPEGLTVASLCETLNTYPQQVRYVLYDVIEAHIAGWTAKPARGRSAAIWASGPGVNVPPPPKRTLAEKNQVKYQRLAMLHARRISKSSAPSAP